MTLKQAWLLGVCLFTLYYNSIRNLCLEEYLFLEFTLFLELIDYVTPDIVKVQNCVFAGKSKELEFNQLLEPIGYKTLHWSKFRTIPRKSKSNLVSLMVNLETLC